MHAFQEGQECCSIPSDFLSQGITSVENERLIREPLGDEISLVVHEISPLKVPGPDGMHVIFYQKYRIFLLEFYVL